MDISEELNPDDMMVYQMTPSSILSVESAAARSTSACGGGGGGAGLGSAELGRRLLLAARHGDTQLVLDLMAKGAPFTTDWLGTSALHLAAAGAHADTCAVLLRAGVSRDARTKVERTPLHLAAYAGHAPVADLLLQHRARPDPRDMLQMTPLHWAAQRGHGEVAALLLRHGADPALESKFKKTPRALALERNHQHILKLIDAVLEDRQAGKSADSPTDADENEPADPQPVIDPIERLQEAVKQTIKQPQAQSEPVKISIERPLESPGSSGAGAAAAAAMLRRHGIALLPRDEGSTVLSALQSGRSVVLSDAGKLMLKESSDIPHVVVKSSPSPAPAPAAVPAVSKGVVLTATPVKSTPRAGVKIFTINNKLLGMPKENKAPIKKVINPHDSMQVQYIKLASDAKITSRSISMKGKQRLPARAASSPACVRLSGGAHKAMYNYNKLVPSPAPAAPAPAPADADSEPDPGENAAAARDVLLVPEQFLTNSSPRYLRAQLLAAHRTIASLSAQLAQYKARLTRLEEL